MTAKRPWVQMKTFRDSSNTRSWGLGPSSGGCVTVRSPQIRLPGRSRIDRPIRRRYSSLSGRRKRPGDQSQYWFTDAIILAVMFHRLLTTTRRNSVESCWQRLQLDPPARTARLPRSVFLRARSASSLLALMGLKSIVKGTQWRWDLAKALKHGDEDSRTHFARQALSSFRR